MSLGFNVTKFPDTHPYNAQHVPARPKAVPGSLIQTPDLKPGPDIIVKDETLADYLNRNYFTRRYTYEHLEDADLCDAIARVAHLVKPDIFLNQTDGQTVRVCAQNYLNHNKREIQPVLTQKLIEIWRIIMESVQKNAHKKGITNPATFGWLLEKLPTKLNNAFRVTMEQYFMLKSEEMRIEVVNELKKYIVDYAHQIYTEEIAAGSETANYVILWALPRELNLSITILTDNMGCFIEDVYCNDQAGEQGTILLVKEIAGYGVLIPPS